MIASICISKACKDIKMKQKLIRYISTIKYMKPSQVYYRLRRNLNWGCSLGCIPKPIVGVPHNIATLEELDFDPSFVNRFNVTEFREGIVTFLHETEKFDWNSKWEIKDKTPLWNFNLHYFEYIHSFAVMYIRTGDEAWIESANRIIKSWIRYNPKNKMGNGWSAYTIALRLTNWLSYFSETKQQADKSVIESIYEQYCFLANHLEKDILGNHYMEDLKALILCALFFSDIQVLNRATSEFITQCEEQILPDGMHYELSPMYHKIMLECLLRTAWALSEAGMKNYKIESYISRMVNVAYSFENGLERTPLFNDSGSNVSKSLEALITAAKKFNVVPEYVTYLESSGYFIIRTDSYVLIIDAGPIGPEFNPGHGHCDAMSYELYWQGKPVIVNCGTYAYQCNERNYFRGTSAHNTVMVEGVEQSDCWSNFRVGNRSNIRNIEKSSNCIAIEMEDQHNNLISRKFCISSNVIVIEDQSQNNDLVSFIHMLDNDEIQVSLVKGYLTPGKYLYAEEYGKYSEINGYQIRDKGQIIYKIEL